MRVPGQRFLFLLEVLLTPSGFVDDSFNLAAIAELHNAFSTSDGVNGSPSLVSSYKQNFPQFHKTQTCT